MSESNVEILIELTPLCTQCREPVDLRSPHVVITITVQTVTHRAGTRVHADRTIGTWHKTCARSWPVPLQRSSS